MELPLVSELQANVVFLDIGSNDLCNPNLLPDDLTSQIISYAARLLHGGCKYVIVGEILPRAGA